MTRYETLELELRSLRLRQVLASMVPAIAITVAMVNAIDSSSGRIWTALATLVALPFILHALWRTTIPSYRLWCNRSAQIVAEISELRCRIATLFEKYRERHKGEHFKKAYDLNGRSVRDLEEALSVGMYRERREVFVTAFVRAGVVVRVTASIGSPFRCSAADNPALWQKHAERLGCDEIRQYHNHPVHDGKTGPSPKDVKTTAALKALMGSCRSQLRSLIICWNSIREWKVFEYDEMGRAWLHFEFDAAR